MLRNHWYLRFRTIAAEGEGGGDHPCGCGEQITQVITTVVNVGSSLRVRGTGRSGHRKRGIDGIIPAGAGNSSAWFDWGIPDWDHPCGCGEQKMIRCE